MAGGSRGLLLVVGKVCSVEEDEESRRVVDAVAISRVEWLARLQDMTIITSEVAKTTYPSLSYLHLHATNFPTQSSTMSRPFLEVFPREIRDQIFTFVLASSSGAVTLSPWTVDVASSLSLLRTCRQIHRECKALIWQHKKLAIREPTQLFQTFQSYNKRKIRRIRELQVSLELIDRDELEWMLSGLKAIPDWCREGRLELIILHAEWDKPRGILEFTDILDLRKYGQSMDGRLYRSIGSFMRMVCQTGWPSFTHWGKERWLKQMLLDPSGVNELLKEIHELFGGRVYVDGLLCFENHAQVSETIKFDPRDVEIRIIPGKPMNNIRCPCTAPEI